MIESEKKETTMLNDEIIPDGRIVKKYHFFESAVYAECSDGTVWAFDPGMLPLKNLHGDIIEKSNCQWVQLPAVPRRDDDKYHLRSNTNVR